MLIRPAQVTDAPAMGRVMVDTFLTAHYGQMAEEVSARNWERARLPFSNVGKIPGRLSMTPVVVMQGVLGV